jgi:YbbR domain-containing protein
MNKKFSFNRLFYRNRFVFVLSLLIAIVLWAVMTSMDTEDHPRAITGVPIVVSLSDSAQADGLRVFSPTDAKATVYIKGNSLIVNQVKASDMEVVAPLASTITSSVNYPFTLAVQKKGNLTDYTVTSISPDQTLITVDRYKEKTFDIQSDISYKDGYQADPTYFVGTPVLSSDRVTISGPEKQVSSVNRVAYEYTVNDTLRNTKQFTADLVLFDANGNKISSGSMKVSPEKVDVSIPVLSRKYVPLSATFTNKPDGFNINSSQVEVNPQTIEIAGPGDLLSTLTSISLTPAIDFSTISPSNNTFTKDITLPSSYSACKNMSNIWSAKVTVNLSGMTTRSITVSSFSVKNLSDGYNATVYTQDLNVEAVGPEAELSHLTGANIVAEINMSGKENFTGQTEMPATFVFSNAPDCWVYGSYMVNLEVAPKS